MGPISSNWDRAVEAYYQLKGGVVDYGACHSVKYDHERFGRNYTNPLLPNLDEKHKISIIAHSQGGQTARMLIKLLVDGSEEEQNCKIQDGDAPMSELYEGGKDWVRSLATISSPHKGSTIADFCAKEMIDIPAYLLGLLNFATCPGKKMEQMFDFKLDHFKNLELDPKPHEEFDQFITRVTKTYLLNDTVIDRSFYDISTASVKEFNDKTKLKQPDKIYYFSYSTAATHPSPYMVFDQKQVPNVDLLLPFIPAAYCMGVYNNFTLGIDEKWHKNDGVVNTISQDGPHSVVPYQGQKYVCPGIWNHCGTLEGYDHIDVIGFNVIANPLDDHYVGDFYYKLAASLLGVGGKNVEYCPAMGAQ
jgi:triacylglycerol lipase